MTHMTQILLLFSFLSLPQGALAEEDLFKIFEKRKPAQVSTAEVNESSAVKADSTWSFLLPAFVVHGVAPANGVSSQMPRKIDSTGRSVATPGFGFEYQGSESLDVVTAFVKDCYDNYAGTIQVGQYFKWRKTSQFGYTVGLYIRETPISCLTQTVTTMAGGGGTGGSHSPPHINTFSSTSCAFQDNLPWRYTFKPGKSYMDIIPSPFVNFSTQIYHGSFDVNLKIISNLYLNEFGIAIPF